MCVSPITITREYRSIGKKFSFTVPCGKCPECLSKRRSEIAALSVLEANVHSSLYFFTLTYRNEELPIAITDDVDGVRRIVGFSRGYKGKAENFCNSVDIGPSGLGPAEAYSLCREDVKLWLKRCRRGWSRLHPDKSLDFSYLICGEYGEQRGRPHYHGLFYGLTAEQAAYFEELWSDRYGFSLVRPQPNPADPSAALKDAPRLCNYISKYMFKGAYSKWGFLMDYVEKPRRQSSIRFGLTDDETLSKLSAFTKGAIFCNMIESRTPSDLNEFRPLLTSLASLIGKKASLYMENISPSPDGLKKN